MTDPTSTRWQRHTLEDGTVRYELPQRPFNLHRFLDALTLLGLALLLCIVSGYLLFLSRHAVPHHLSAGVVGGGLGLLALLGLGLNLFRVGLTMLPPARLTIEVRQRELCVVSRFGPVWRTRRLGLAHIAALQVEPYARARLGWSRRTTVVHRLAARGPQGPLTLAEDYPLSWLQELAADLSGHCRRVEVEPRLVKRLPELPVVAGPGQPVQDGARQPSISRAVVRREGDVLTVAVPRPGPFGPQSWILALVVVPLIVAFITGTGILSGSVSPWVLPVPIAGVIVAVFGLIAFVRVVTTTSTLTVSPSGLVVHQQSALHQRTRTWSLTEILDVTLGPSRLPAEKGRPAPPEMKLILDDKREVGLLAGYPEAELRWLSRLLHETLARQPSKPPPTLDDVLAKVPGGRIAVTRLAGVLTLACPPVGLPLKMLAYMLFGLCFVAGGGVGQWRLLDLAAQGHGWPANWAGWIAAPPAILLGLAVLTEAVIDSRRRRLFLITDDELRVQDFSWLGLKERSWRREEILTAEVDPPPGALADVIPMIQLILRLKNGKGKMVSIWQSADEMVWLARVLRLALDLEEVKRPD